MAAIDENTTSNILGRGPRQRAEAQQNRQNNTANDTKNNRRQRLVGNVSASQESPVARILQNNTRATTKSLGEIKAINDNQHRALRELLTVEKQYASQNLNESQLTRRVLSNSYKVESNTLQAITSADQRERKNREEDLKVRSRWLRMDEDRNKLLNDLTDALGQMANAGRSMLGAGAGFLAGGAARGLGGLTRGGLGALISLGTALGNLSVRGISAAVSGIKHGGKAILEMATLSNVIGNLGGIMKFAGKASLAGAAVMGLYTIIENIEQGLGPAVNKATLGGSDWVSEKLGFENTQQLFDQIFGGLKHAYDKTTKFIKNEINKISSDPGQYAQNLPDRIWTAITAGYQMATSYTEKIATNVRDYIENSQAIDDIGKYARKEVNELTDNPAKYIGTIPEKIVSSLGDLYGYASEKITGMLPQTDALKPKEINKFFNNISDKTGNLVEKTVENFLSSLGRLISSRDIDLDDEQRQTVIGAVASGTIDLIGSAIGGLVSGLYDTVTSKSFWLGTEGQKGLLQMINDMAKTVIGWVVDGVSSVGRSVKASISSKISSIVDSAEREMEEIGNNFTYLYLGLKEFVNRQIDRIPFIDRSGRIEELSSQRKEIERERTRNDLQAQRRRLADTPTVEAVRQELEPSIGRSRGRIAEYQTDLKPIRSELSQKQESLREQQRTVARYEQMREKGEISQEKLEEARTQRNVTRDEVRTLQNRIDYFERRINAERRSIENAQEQIENVKEERNQINQNIEKLEKKLETEKKITEEKAKQSSLETGTQLPGINRGLSDNDISRIYGGVLSKEQLNRKGIFPSSNIQFDRGILPNAKGNIFNNNNIVPFAEGGVVGQPTLFDMVGPKTGLMGEAGPEAIMPLDRTDSGRLGISMSDSQRKTAQMMQESASVISKAIARASQVGDMSMGMARAFGQVESSLNPKARNPNSSATGLYQFTRGTWNNLVDQYGDQYDISKVSKGMGKDDPRLNAEKNAIMFGLLTKQNAGGLKMRIGREPTENELYMAHMFGVGTASKLIQASPSTPAQNVLGMDVMNANPFLRGMTVGEVKQTLNDKITRAKSTEPSSGQMDISTVEGAINAAKDMASGKSVSDAIKSGTDTVSNVANKFTSMIKEGGVPKSIEGIFNLVSKVAGKADQTWEDYKKKFDEPNLQSTMDIGSGRTLSVAEARPTGLDGVGSGFGGPANRGSAGRELNPRKYDPSPSQITAKGQVGTEKMSAQRTSVFQGPSYSKQGAEYGSATSTGNMKPVGTQPQQQQPATPPKSAPNEKQPSIEEVPMVHTDYGMVVINSHILV